MSRYVLQPPSFTANSKRPAAPVDSTRHYRPPVHLDEIGLTTDKYVPLNDSVHSLDLSLSFGPMSLQVTSF